MAVSARGAIRRRPSVTIGDAVGGTLGAEYRINPKAFIGAAFNYANPSANLNGNGTTEINSYQVGVYSAWVGAHLCKVLSAAACSNIATCASASSI
jgi:outer membrane autotransporter protein